MKIFRHIFTLTSKFDILVAASTNDHQNGIVINTVNTVAATFACTHEVIVANPSCMDNDNH